MISSLHDKIAILFSVIFFNGRLSFKRACDCRIASSSYLLDWCNLDGNDVIIEGVKYPGTRGLWELIVLKEPSEDHYYDNDLATYSEIMINTNAMKRDNDPNNPRPKSSKSLKWNNVVKDIWDNKDSFQGTGTKPVVIPSNPNALLERLDLLMASREAGNTGTRNELVSICDELLRPNVIYKNEY